MAAETVTVTRIYLREGEHLLAGLLKLLHDEEKTAGLTVFRGIAGFGADGSMHLSSLSDLSLDLPLIIEFYDTPERAAAILQRLYHYPGVKHLISWQALSFQKP